MQQENFRDRVFAVLKTIPKGSVMTYKEVAIRAGNPGASRAVGNSIGKNYDPAIPCHRVIRSDGRLGGYNRGVAKKIALLQKEGVPIVQGRVRIDVIHGSSSV